MDSIRIEYFYEYDGPEKYLCMKVLDEVWERQMPVLFFDIAALFIASSQEKICFDFSPMQTVSSIVLGPCANILRITKDLSKVKLRFSAEAADVVRAANFDQIVKIEVV